MKSLDLTETLKAKFPDAVAGTESQTGRPVTLLKPAGLLGVMRFLRDDPSTAFDILVDLAGADYSALAGREGGGLCVSYQLLSTTQKQRGWVKVYTPLEGAKVPSLVPVYDAANWYERECWDMYGIEFEGHPNLTRLLLYDEFKGHPLRKDYPILKMQPLIPMRNAVDYEAVRVASRKAEG